MTNYLERSRTGLCHVCGKEKCENHTGTCAASWCETCEHRETCDRSPVAA